jgi:ribosomal protein S18 acetylase RimI-like enzyme
MKHEIVEAKPDGDEAAALIAELDAQLDAHGYPAASRHGYSVEKLLREAVAFFVIRCDGVAAGCGGVQRYGTEYAELKRMYVRPSFRRLGLGRAILDHLADHARRGGAAALRLETGIHQEAAIALYESFGFGRRAPFGEYREDPLSLFFEMKLT